MVKRIAWVLSWPLAAIVLALTSWLAVRAGDTDPVPVDVLMSGVFIVSGLIVMGRDRESRIGPLMVAAGFASRISDLGHSGVPILYSLGHSFDSLEPVLIAHLILAYPSGRARTLPARLTLVFGYGSAVALGLVQLLVFNPQVSTGCLCPRTPFGYFPNPPVHHAAGIFKDLASAIAVVFALGIVVHRLATSSPPRRRALSALWVAALASGAAFTLRVLTTVVDVPLAARNAMEIALSAVTMVVPISFFIGLLRRELHKIAVGDLVVRLGDVPPAGGLRDALATALHDPSLDVVFRMRDCDRWVDADGHPVGVPTSSIDRSVTFVEHLGVPLAALVHDPFLASESELVRSVSAAASLALQNERLHAEVRANLEEVRASRARIVEASDDARRKIERDLHDGAQQRLLSLALSLRMTRDSLDGASDVVRRALEGAEQETRAAIDELRELARGIHPAVLTEQGLAVAAEQLAERAPLPVGVGIVNERYPAPIEAAAYFVIAEALSNVFKYANATRADVSIKRDRDHLVVEVSDNGVGGADLANGSGLRGLKDRVAAIDGQFEVDSPSGHGTRVRARIPCP